MFEEFRVYYMEVVCRFPAYRNFVPESETNELLDQHGLMVQNRYSYEQEIFHVLQEKVTCCWSSGIPLDLWELSQHLISLLLCMAGTHPSPWLVETVYCGM